MNPASISEVRTAKELFEHLPEDARGRLVAEDQPSFIDPMLATLTDKRFSDPDWLFETKFDGERCLAFRSGDRLRLLSRKQQHLNATYPELADALAAQPLDDFVVDGEVVAFDGERTSFGRLQQRLGLTDPQAIRARGVTVYYYLFDVLYLQGHDTTGLPLRQRKALLKRALSFEDPLRYTAHRVGEGEAAYDDACAKGLEGIIAKRASSEYASRRSPDWLKFKCSETQEFVIGGFTEPRGSRTGLGALLVGYYEDGTLVYAGKVGTGYTQKTLRDLRSRLEALEQEEPAFRGPGARERGTHWVRPALVAQVSFSEWTEDGKLRHPRFEGMRRDKSPREVIRES
ncbi:MAG: non-homologous end-joining DNA ligase [Acidimicrobiales bacterium]|nr:non-homologous end-joining DNA ligase [Acidimicrobiales bacterium]